MFLLILKVIELFIDMAANARQRITRVPNDGSLKSLLESYLNQGYVLHQMINLAPVANYILIIYYDPAVDEVPEA